VPALKPQKPLHNSLKNALVLGVLLSIGGAVFWNISAKFTTENYVGYGLLMGGLVALILGGAGIATFYVLGTERWAFLFNSAVAITAGFAMLLLGSVTASEWAQYTAANYVGFGTMLAGIFTVSFGVFGVINGFVKAYLERVKLGKSIMVQEKTLLGSLWIIAFAIGSALVGWIIASTWATVSLENYFGYGVLLVGIVTLLLGHAGLVSAYASPYLSTFRARRILISQLETNDLDAISDAIAKNFISETEKKLLNLLQNNDEITMDDLARSLGLSLSLTRKLLMRSLQHKSINGYVTLDGEKYLSKNGLRKNMESLLLRH
jgi:hypothetical protein